MGEEEEEDMLEEGEQHQPGWQGTCEDLPFQPSTYQDRPSVGVEQHQGWSSGPAGGHLQSHVITQNVGPVGLWNSLPAVERMAQGNPTAILLQDTRMGDTPRARDQMQKALRWVAPLYHAQFESTRQRVWDSVKQKRVSKMIGVCTLLHNEMRPVQDAELLSSFGLKGAQLKACEGRVMVLMAAGRSAKADAYINIYQHVGARLEQQKLVWTAVQTVVRKLRGKVNLILMAGDFNASKEGRMGYAGDFTKVDEGFVEFVRQVQAEPATGV